MTAPQVEQVEPGVYSVLVEGRSYEARVEQVEGGVAVFVDGHRFEIEVHDPRRWRRQTGGREIAGRLNVVAPMPGKIVRLLVVEAMKMQNEVKAPKAGRVVSMTGREGATAAAGDVLAIIE